MTEKSKFVDLGLDYATACHGRQSVLAMLMSQNPNLPRTQPKHMRISIDSMFAENMAIVRLLMDKGVFTEEEYLEYVRLAANDELNRWEQEASQLLGFPVTGR